MHSDYDWLEYGEPKFRGRVNILAVELRISPDRLLSILKGVWKDGHHIARLRYVGIEIPEAKVCIDCGDLKPRSEYYRHSVGLLRGACKVCWNDRQVAQRKLKRRTCIQCNRTKDAKYFPSPRTMLRGSNKEKCLRCLGKRFLVTLTCSACGKTFKRDTSRYRHANTEQPVCTRKCALTLANLSKVLSPQ